MLQETFEHQNPVDVYWITKGFYKCALEIADDFSELKKLTYKLLEKECPHISRYFSRHSFVAKQSKQMCRLICSHFEKTNLLEALPLEQWYASCFSGVLTKPSLVRIWDKICGGSRKIVVFVFIMIVSTLWRPSKLSSTDQLSEVVKIIGNVRLTKYSHNSIRITCPLFCFRSKTIRKRLTL